MSSFPASFSNSNFRNKTKVKDAIPTSIVFSHIKSDLVQFRGPRDLRSITARGAPLCMHAAPFCPRCLSEGHHAFSCASDVRCLWCFGYGHKKSSCFRRRASRLTLWKAKNAIMTPATAALEPHVEVTPHTIEETGVDETGETVPSLRQKETISPSVPPKNPPSLPLQSALSLLSPSLPAPALSHPLPSATMANFAVHPEPFIPPVMFVEDGRPQRRVRHEIYVRGGVPKTHEDYTIAVVDDNLSITERHQLLHDITNLVVTQYQVLCSASSWGWNP
jgi:hypothetical protein